MGRKSTFKYHIVYHAWIAYLRLVNLDYPSLYTCPQCKLQPKIVILDGIAMGTMRSLPDVIETEDYDQKYSLIEMSERVFIHDLSLRRKIFNYSLQGLAEDNFNELVNIQDKKEFCDYITSTSSKLDNWMTISEDHERVRKVIQLLCRNEPITGLFQFSILDASERKFIVQLSDGGSAKEESLNLIYQKMHTLECLIKSIQPSIDISGYARYTQLLPHY